MKIQPSSGIYAKCLKRFFDFTLSFFACIFLSPVFVVIILLEYIYHGAPIFYLSQRPGKEGKIFTIYKFRSMTNETDVQGRLLPAGKRLTPFGILLRRVSLDELPQLFNIIKGDMAIIGPRPLGVGYLPLYGPRYSQRHLVRPGLACIRIRPGDTPWTWREQFENDLYYIENISFSLDMWMMWRTIISAFQGRKDRTYANRPAFTGVTGANFDASPEER